MIESICVNSVLVRAMAPAPDADADDIPTPSPGTAYAASVQMAGEAEAALQGRQGGLAVGVVYFATEPLDTSAGADHPRLRVRDRIDWQADGVNPTPRTLLATGPPKPEGGFGAAWSVDVEEVS